MAINLKSAEEIEKMRIAGKLAADVLTMIEPYVVPGVSTDELDQRCHNYIIDQQQAIPAPLNYKGFPKSICTSVNHQICHGIPNSKKLKKGDIINIDITIIKDEYHGDTSKMFYVGNPSPQAKRLCEVAQKAMYLGILQIKPKAYIGDIGHAIQAYTEANYCSIVREYCGHGIGKKFHDAPQILHYGKPETGIQLETGMTFTVEPMVNLGKRYIKHLSDGWTVITKDRSLSAQWEHTILVTDTSFEILTLREEEVNWKQNL